MTQKTINEVSQLLHSHGVAEIQVSYKPTPPKEQIENSRDVVELLRNSWTNGIALHESFYIVLLGRNMKIKGIIKISDGSVGGTVIDIPRILAMCLVTASPNLILAHNHPSGNINPSNADIKITKKLKKAAEIMDIKVLDHVILSPFDNEYYSMADEYVL